MKNTIDTTPSHILKFDKNYIDFEIIEENGFKHSINLQAGYDYIVSRFFRNDFPTEAETEYAINYIEDILMSQKVLMSNGEDLNTSENVLIQLFKRNGMVADKLSRQEVEALFSQYAYVLMGGAGTSRVSGPITRIDFAALLILREVMHHLNFDSLRFVA